MKNIKITAILLTFVLALSMVLISCGKNLPEMLSYEGTTMTSAEFSFSLAEQKGYVVDIYQNYLQKDISADIEFWNTDINGTTFAETVKTGALEIAKKNLLIKHYCNEYGLELTDETVLKDLEEKIENVTNDFGGEDLLALELAKYGIGFAQLKEYYKNIEKTKLLFDYWYGENGNRRLAESVVRDNFDKNFHKVDVITYTFYDSDNQLKQDEIVTEQELEFYFNNNYVKVQHILYMTVDLNEKPLEEDKINEIRIKAEASFNDIIDGSISFEDKKSESEDSGNDLVFTYGTMVNEFEKASFEMEVDEVRLVETKFGFHIIKKFALEDTDLEKNSTGVQEAVIKTKLKNKVDRLFDDLKSGEAKFEENEEYYFSANQVLSVDDLSQLGLEELITGLEDGEFEIHEINDSGRTAGYYLFLKKPVNDEDFYDKYSFIEENLSYEAFNKYLETHFDKIVVNEEEYAKFDVITTVSFPYYGE